MPFLQPTVAVKPFENKQVLGRTYFVVGRVEIVHPRIGTDGQAAGGIRLTIVDLAEDKYRE